MPSPFPGMDPYLEDPERWSTLQNRLIVALADYLTPQLLPKYQVDIEKRVYEILEAVKEAYLEIKEAATQEVVTAIELLSPKNKRGDGRQQYEAKRTTILSSRTNLVEIDLLRLGRSLPLNGPTHPSRYRLLVSRATERPLADLYAFNLTDPMPLFPVPLLAHEQEPLVDLKPLLDGVYDRSGYSYFIDYQQDPSVGLTRTERQWVDQVLQTIGLRKLLQDPIP